MQDLSSPTRGWHHASYSESTESQPQDHQGSPTREDSCIRSRQWYQPLCHPGHKTQMDKDAVRSLWRLLMEENLQPETLGSWNKTIIPATENHLSFENRLLICFWALVETVLWWWVASDSLEKTLMLGKTERRKRSRDGGWDGWMASPTQWMWIWVNSRRWWRTRKPGVLQSMGLQRIGPGLVTK